MDRPTTRQPVLTAPLREQLEAFIDEHRTRLVATLDGLTESEVRASLVPSRTTLLGLVKHSTSVEKVWFEGAVSGRTRAQMGIGETIDQTFVLDNDDTIESVVGEYRAVCARSRVVAANLDPDDTLPYHRFGPLPLRWAYIHLVRELAQHLGHAEILREQIIARRDST